MSASIRTFGARAARSILLNGVKGHAAKETTLATQGKSAWEIGEILCVAKRVVDEHAQTAIRKLGAANRTQAVAIAIRHRLFEV
jgi:DNA-binding CsgD family transcriptional regulator